jgi:hypothetical protein
MLKNSNVKFTEKVYNIRKNSLIIICAQNTVSAILDTYYFLFCKRISRKEGGGGVFPNSFNISL